MYNKRSTFARMAASWSMAIGLLAVLLFSAVGPAYAAGGTIQHPIGVAAQVSALTYGTAGTASFQVSVTSTGTINNVVFAIAGLPAGATGAFVPAKLSFTGAQTKITTLTISTAATTPAGPDMPFTVRYRVAGKIGSAFGTGHLAIGPRLLDVQGKLVQDKAYDGNTNATLNPACTAVITTDCASLGNVLSGDLVTLNTATGHGVFAAKDSGAEDVSVTGLTIGGTGASNYALPDPVSASANINKAALTVTADNAFKVVGFADPEFTMSYSGFANNEGPADLTPAPTCGVSVAHIAAGTYPITCGGGNAQNYSFGYVDGTLTVNASDNVPTNITLAGSSVPEMKPIGTFVGNLTTTDLDSVDGEKYSYSLVNTLACAGPDNNYFHVDATVKSTGPVPLTTAAILHYATKQSYTICVETNDQNGGLFDKQFVVNTMPSTMTLKSQAFYDGWVLESGEFTNQGGAMNSANQTLIVGDDANNKQYKSILSFNTSLVPSNATIYGVTIKIEKAHLTDANLFPAFKGLRIDVIKPSYGVYALQFTDFQFPPTVANGLNNACAFGPVADAFGFYSSVNCGPVLPFINRASATQFRLHFGLDDNNNHIANYLSFYSGNAGQFVQPQLIITYSVP